MNNVLPCVDMLTVLIITVSECGFLNSSVSHSQIISSSHSIYQVRLVFPVLGWSQVPEVKCLTSIVQQYIPAV